MKTSLGGIASIALIIVLTLSQRGGAQLLDEGCRNSTRNQASAWTAVLRNGTHLLCAGSLIHSQFVLTSAQCIEGQNSLSVMLGAKDIHKPFIKVPVKMVNIHRSYSRIEGRNDIALLMLLNKVNYTDQVRPICILLNAEVQNHGNQIGQLQSFKAVGWGIGTGGQQSNLAQISIDRLHRNYCGIKPEESSFCGRPSIEGSCGGDIGGPVSIIRKLEDQEDIPVQYGIVSSGVRKCTGARTYIDVTRYADWIERSVSVSVRFSEDSEISLDTKIQRPKSPSSEDVLLYTDCGETYLTANIYGPDFMAKGVMITHRFVLTTARDLTKDASSLRVGVQGQGSFQELAIDSVYNHPEYLKTDIALLKLSSELIPENIMKPICILRRPVVEQSRPTLAILDIDRRRTNLVHNFHEVSPIQKRSCSTSLRVQVQPTDICLQTPSGIKQVFGIRGNVVSQKIVIPGKNSTNYRLFGIVKYSERGLNLITDVTSYTDWIASVVSENSV